MIGDMIKARSLAGLLSVLAVPFLRVLRRDGPQFENVRLQAVSLFLLSFFAVYRHTDG